MKRRMLKLTALAGTAVTALSLAACGGGSSGVVRVHQTEVIH